LTKKSKLAMNPVRLPNKPDPLRTEMSAGRFRERKAAGYRLQSRALGIGRFPFPWAPDLPSLDPIAGLPNEQNIGGDQADHDKHPVLDLEAQNGETLDQKLHRSRPLFGQDKRFGDGNILFLYF
jgi:hypothetical protein